MISTEIVNVVVARKGVLTFKVAIYQRTDKNLPEVIPTLFAIDGKTDYPLGGLLNERRVYASMSGAHVVDYFTTNTFWSIGDYHSAEFVAEEKARERLGYVR